MEDYSMKGFQLIFLFSLVAFSMIFTTGWATTTFPGDEDYLAFAEDMPTPNGGLEGIVKLVKYPEIAKKAGVQGKVFILAYINENGGVDDVKIIKGIGAGCDEAAIEAVKKTKFSSGKSQGKNVKVKLSISLTFKL